MYTRVGTSAYEGRFGAEGAPRGSDEAFSDRRGRELARDDDETSALLRLAHLPYEEGAGRDAHASAPPR